MNSEKSGGVSFLSLLAIVFITLKLTSVIDWSWWYVTMPLWGVVALVLSLAVLYALSLGVIWLYKYCIGK